jgi:hypothetical protein
VLNEAVCQEARLGYHRRAHDTKLFTHQRSRHKHIIWGIQATGNLSPPAPIDRSSIYIIIVAPHQNDSGRLTLLPFITTAYLHAAATGTDGNAASDDRVRVRVRVVRVCAVGFAWRVAGDNERASSVA